MKLISQGAEAKLYRDGSVLTKERIKKSYRIKEIDTRLRQSRTRQEANLLREARIAGIATPQILDVGKFEIRMEFIDGERVKEVLCKNPSQKQVQEIGTVIGKSIALLHEYNIIHGDLTTSNMLLKENKIYFIDFGLGFHSSRIEDKATDLYLLYHAIESTHWQLLEKLWKIILNTYKENYPEAGRIIKTLSDIEKRGRYHKRDDNG